MRCPFCRLDNDRVLDTRASDDGFAIRRRRICNHCRRRYTTYERLEEQVMRVVKKDQTREPFDRQKIHQGIQRACWKRPISPDQIDATAASIADKVHQQFDVEVDSRTIGELVMQELAALDKVAYVRFASIYRDFADVHDFVRELRPYLQDPRSGEPAPPARAPQ